MEKTLTSPTEANDINSAFGTDPMGKEVLGLIFTSLNLKHISQSEVGPQTPLLKGGLNLDSVDILELIVTFEQKFSIKLNESEEYSKHFRDVGSVVEFVKLKLEQKKTGDSIQ
jgi:acyl carrier protein